MTDAPKKKSDVTGILFGLFIFGWVMSRVFSSVDHFSPVAPELTPMQQELRDEQEFLENEKPPYVWAAVRLEDGTLQTGRVVFTPQCPTGRLCAEPDATVRDEDGVDISMPDDSPDLADVQ